MVRRKPERINPAFTKADRRQAKLEKGETAEEPSLQFLDRLRGIEREEEKVSIKTSQGQVEGSARITRKNETFFNSERGIETLEYVDTEGNSYGKKETIYDQKSGIFLEFRRYNATGELLHEAVKKGIHSIVEVRQYNPQESGPHPIVEQKYLPDGELIRSRVNAFDILAPDEERPGKWKKVDYPTEDSIFAVRAYKETEPASGRTTEKSFTYDTDGRLKSTREWYSSGDRKPDLRRTDTEISGARGDHTVRRTVYQYKESWSEKYPNRVKETEKEFQDGLVVRFKEEGVDERFYTYDEKGNRVKERVKDLSSGREGEVAERTFKFDERDKVTEAVEELDGDLYRTFEYQYGEIEDIYKRQGMNKIIIEDFKVKKRYTLEPYNPEKHAGKGRSFGRETLALPAEAEDEKFVLVRSESIDVVPD